MGGGSQYAAVQGHLESLEEWDRLTKISKDKCEVQEEPLAMVQGWGLTSLGSRSAANPLVALVDSTVGCINRHKASR